MITANHTEYTCWQKIKECVTKSINPNTKPTVAKEIATGIPIMSMIKNPPNIRKAIISGLNMASPFIPGTIEIYPYRFCSALKGK